MPNKNKRDEKRDAIILGAYTQFRIYGYRKTSMEDIARELGISRASLYSYFENKDEIFRSVSLHLHEEALAAAEQSLAGDWSNENVAEKLVGALQRAICAFTRNSFNHPTPLNCRTSTVVCVVTWLFNRT